MADYGPTEEGFIHLPVTARNITLQTSDNGSPAFPHVPDRQPLECPHCFGLRCWRALPYYREHE